MTANLNEELDLDDVAEELFDGDDYESVTKEEMTDHSRWTISYTQVFRRKADGTFWRANWVRGATEHQDIGIEMRGFYQVVPVEKTITVYEEK